MDLSPASFSHIPAGLAWVEIDPAIGERLWSVGLAKGSLRDRDGCEVVCVNVLWKADGATGMGRPAPKYIKRVPKPGGGYRYYYAAHEGGGVHNAAHFGVGSSFAHEGGHFHIKGEGPDGMLHVEHSHMPGQRVQMTRDELAAKLKEHHGEALETHRKGVLERFIRDIGHAAGKRKEALEKKAEKYGYERPKAEGTEEKKSPKPKVSITVKTDEGKKGVSNDFSSRAMDGVDSLRKQRGEKTSDKHEAATPIGTPEDHEKHRKAQLAHLDLAKLRDKAMSGEIGHLSRSEQQAKIWDAAEAGGYAKELEHAVKRDHDRNVKAANSRTLNDLSPDEHLAAMDEHDALKAKGKLSPREQDRMDALRQKLGITEPEDDSPAAERAKQEARNEARVRNDARNIRLAKEGPDSLYGIEDKHVVNERAKANPDRELSWNGNQAETTHGAVAAIRRAPDGTHEGRMVTPNGEVIKVASQKLGSDAESAEAVKTALQREALKAENRAPSKGKPPVEVKSKLKGERAEERGQGKARGEAKAPAAAEKKPEPAADYDFSGGAPDKPGAKPAEPAPGNKPPASRVEHDLNRSSNVKRVSWDPEKPGSSKGAMRVHFDNGAVHEYSGVHHDDYNKVVTADSPGAAFNEHIKKLHESKQLRGPATGQEKKEAQARQREARAGARERKVGESMAKREEAQAADKKAAPAESQAKPDPAAEKTQAPEKGSSAQSERAAFNAAAPVTKQAIDAAKSARGKGKQVNLTPDVLHSGAKITNHATGKVYQVGDVRANGDAVLIEEPQMEDKASSGSKSIVARAREMEERYANRKPFPVTRKEIESLAANHPGAVTVDPHYSATITGEPKWDRFESAWHERAANPSRFIPANESTMKPGRVLHGYDDAPEGHIIGPNGEIGETGRNVKDLDANDVLGKMHVTKSPAERESEKRQGDIFAAPQPAKRGKASEKKESSPKPSMPATKVADDDISAPDAPMSPDEEHAEHVRQRDMLTNLANGYEREAPKFPESERPGILSSAKDMRKKAAEHHAKAEAIKPTEKPKEAPAKPESKSEPAKPEAKAEAPKADAPTAESHFANAKDTYGLSDKDMATVRKIAEQHVKSHAEAGRHEQAKAYTRDAVQQVLAGTRNMSPSQANKWMREKEKARVAKALTWLLASVNK